jgi:hypothetical protein
MVAHEHLAEEFASHAPRIAREERTIEGANGLLRSAGILPAVSNSCHGFVERGLALSVSGAEARRKPPRPFAFA